MWNNSTQAINNIATLHRALFSLHRWVAIRSACFLILPSTTFVHNNSSSFEARMFCSLLPPPQLLGASCSDGFQFLGSQSCRASSTDRRVIIVHREHEPFTSQPQKFQFVNHDKRYASFAAAVHTVPLIIPNVRRLSAMDRWEAPQII